MLQALSELSVLKREIFHDDEALAVFGIPVGVVARGRRDVQCIAHEIIKAGLELTDVDVAKFAGPVRLQAHVLRDSGIPADLVQIERQTQLGRMRIDELDDFHVLDDQPRIAVLQQTREPPGIHLLHDVGKLFRAARIRSVARGIGLIKHAVSPISWFFPPHCGIRCNSPNYSLRPSRLKQSRAPPLDPESSQTRLEARSSEVNHPTRRIV